MRFNRHSRSLIVAVVAFALAIMLSNCDRTPKQSTNNSPTKSSALVYASAGQPVNLEPGNVRSSCRLSIQSAAGKATP